MLKKFLVIIFMWISLYGSYYSVVDTTPTNNKTYIYEDNNQIKVLNNVMKLITHYDISKYSDNRPPMKFDDTKFKVKEEEENLDGSISIKTKIIEYPTYNFSYILNNPIDNEEFVLKNGNRLYFVKVKNSTDEIEVFGNQKEVSKYEFIITKSFTKNSSKSEDIELLTKYVDENGGIVAIDILDNGVKHLYKIVTPGLKKFLREKAIRKVVVDKFDFNKEQIYTSYVNNDSLSSKRLNITYGMRKGFIKIVLESPVSLLDPKNKSDEIEQNIGFLKEYRNDLYEVKKVQLINGEIEVSWKNLPNKSVVIVDYMNEGNPDRSILSKTPGQQFYSIEGVFYLVSWMYKNGINKKIFTFMNGYLPFDVTITKTSSRKFAITKQGHIIYIFEVNNLGVVKDMKFPAFDINLKLDSLESDTTIKNKKYLKALQEKYHIELIKE